MQCYNSTTFRMCLFSLVSKPEQKIKSKSKTIQNKCIRFSLQLDIKSFIGIKFEQINRLPVSERFNQYIFCNAFKFLSKNCPLYLRDL